MTWMCCWLKDNQLIVHRFFCSLYVCSSFICSPSLKSQSSITLIYFLILMSRNILEISRCCHHRTLCLQLKMDVYFSNYNLPAFAVKSFRRAALRLIKNGIRAVMLSLNLLNFATRFCNTENENCIDRDYFIVCDRSSSIF